MLIHARSGQGKSRLLDTAPGPRLVLDVEGGADWTPSRKIEWNPAGPIPTQFPDGSPIDTDTTVVVTVLDFHTLKLAYEWLSTGNHYFESVCIDSLTEAQKRCKDEIGGSSQFTEQMWGQLLGQMEVLIRQYRDLKKHPIKPVNVFIAAITNYKDDVWQADVQGALGRSLPGFVDVNSYLYNQPTADGTGRPQRNLLIAPTAQVDAKDRTDKLTQRFGMIIPTSVGSGADAEQQCDLRTIVEVLNGRA